VSQVRSLSGRPDGPDQFEQEGWPGQLARVERWYRRASDVLDPGRRAPEAEIVDFLYAFFQSAYHLRDWLLNSGGASKAEIEALFADSPCLRFCADVCNGSKHFVLDPKRHTTARIGRMLEYVPPLPGSDVDGMRPTVLAFQDHGGYVDFVPIDGLLRDCTTTWQQFCSTR
jgi:hypothetical protein